MKIRLVGAELFRADRRTDKHDEANSRLTKYCEHAIKKRSIRCAERVARIAEKSLREWNV
jgi:hypothetical protein